MPLKISEIQNLSKTRPKAVRRIPTQQYPILTATPEQQITWLAALVDGEGSISLDLRRYEKRVDLELQIQIGNRNIDVIACVQQIVGFGTSHVQLFHQGKPYATYVVCCKQARIFLDKVKKYLVVKQPQARLIDKFYALDVGEHAHHSEPHIYTKEQIQCFIQLRKCNHSEGKLYLNPNFRLLLQKCNLENLYYDEP